MSSGAWGGGRGEGGRVDCVEGVWSSVHTCGRGVCTERGGVGGGGGSSTRRWWSAHGVRPVPRTQAGSKAGRQAACIVVHHGPPTELL